MQFTFIFKRESRTRYDTYFLIKEESQANITVPWIYRNFQADHGK